MGILGSLNSTLLLDEFLIDNSTDSLLINNCLNCLYHGTDWMYTFVETFWAYDFKLYYFNFNNIIFDDSFDFFFSTIWYLNINFSNFNLFWSVIIDQYILNNFYKIFYNNDWYRNILLSKENSLLFIYHPEIIFLNFLYLSTIYFNATSNVFISIVETNISESFLSPIMKFSQLLFVLYLVTIFVNFYFTYYNTSVKEESTIDSDFISSNLLVESEKEIGSLDDMILGLIVLSYIFGWYVYIYVWTVISVFPEIIMIFYSFPFLYYIIISMPTYLLYDFGIYFLTYLRGVGSTSLLTMELMYDYIAFSAFYIRLMVQGVRLVLMIFTYISLHDLIIFFDFDLKLFTGFELIWEDLANFNGTFNSFSYFFFFIIPIKIIYWLYELFHTFFVITAQFVAFFAMVFWLFLFLYTMFVLEKHENYFSEKRKIKKNQLKRLLILKE